VALAALSSAGYAAVIGGYVLIVLFILLLQRRDVYGRPRALGCIFGIALFGLGFVVAFAAWAADNIF
jgi:hypothetical protein